MCWLLTLLQLPPPLTSATWDYSLGKWLSIADLTSVVFLPTGKLQADQLFADISCMVCDFVQKKNKKKQKKKTERERVGMVGSFPTQSAASCRRVATTLCGFWFQFWCWILPSLANEGVSTRAARIGGMGTAIEAQLQCQLCSHLCVVSCSVPAVFEREHNDKGERCAVQKRTREWKG